MLNKIKVGLLILGKSLRLILKNKKLALFPILTILIFAAIISVSVVYFSSSVINDMGQEVSRWEVFEPTLWQEDGTGGEEKASPKGFFIFCLIYLLSMFIITFFNVAIFNEIIMALKGQGVSLLRGLSFAISRLQEIIFWSLLAGAVGILIAKLERRAGFIGSIVLRIIGIAWSVASVFAIPVIVTGPRESNPINILKKSASLIKKVWGQALTGFLGIQGGVILILVLSTLLLIIGMFFLPDGMFLIGVLGIFIEIILVSYFINVAESVFKCVLFVYAETGKIPEGYSQEVIDIAWDKKQ